MSENAALVSVIIATRDRAALLAQTLDALAAQRYPRDRFEIIVADNGSVDGTRAVVEASASRSESPVTRYVYVAESGKSNAVNAALPLARGSLLAFIDDDVLPEPSWIERLSVAFTETNADFVAGRILPRWETAPPPWLSTALYGVLAIPDSGERRLRIEAGGNGDIIPIGANMAVRSGVTKQLGGLRPDLGKRGRTLQTGEDHEFFLRMLHAGYRGVYEPSALVRHWVPRDRLKRAYFRRWLYQNGQDVARLEIAYTPGQARLLGVPRYLWWRAAANGLRSARAAVMGDSRTRFASVGQLIWFGGYLRQSWLRRPVRPSRTVRMAEER
jgi:glycosyltransferase involved in cell wall biosynthesis